jgi:hypothetical protein
MSYATARLKADYMHGYRNKQSITSGSTGIDRIGGKKPSFGVAGDTWARAITLVDKSRLSQFDSEANGKGDAH